MLIDSGMTGLRSAYGSTNESEDKGRCRGVRKTVHCQQKEMLMKFKQSTILRPATATEQAGWWKVEG